jgi:hypothetical protein
MRATMRAVARFGVFVAAAGTVARAGLVTGGLSSACTTEPDPVYYDGGGDAYCSGLFAKPIPARECTGCSSQAFALCNGNTFNECICELPSDYSLDSGTFEAANPLSPEGSLASFDASILPCCQGKAALEIPAANCPLSCAGTVAYAICQDNAYTVCACDIPREYALPDYTCDGG